MGWVAHAAVAQLRICSKNVESVNMKRQRALKPAIVVMLALVLSSACDDPDKQQDGLQNALEIATDVSVRSRELETVRIGVDAKLDELRREQLAIEALTFESAQRRKAELEPKLEAVLASMAAEPEPPASLEREFETIAGDIVALQRETFDRLSQPLSLDPALDSRYWDELYELGLQGDVGDMESFDYRAESTRGYRLALCGGQSGTGGESKDVRNVRASKCAEILRHEVTAAEFEQRKRGRIDTIRRRLHQLEAVDERIAATQDRLTTSMETVLKSHGSSFDKLVRWGVTALAVVVGAIIIAGRRWRKRGSDEAVFASLVLPLITVILLVFAILILGLGGKIESEALGALVGGISGYVLSKSSRSEESEPTRPGGWAARVELLQNAIVDILQARGKSLADADIAQVRACQDVATLERWYARAQQVDSVADMGWKRD